MYGLKAFVKVVVYCFVVDIVEFFFIICVIELFYSYVDIDFYKNDGMFVEYLGIDVVYLWFIVCKVMFGIFRNAAIGLVKFDVWICVFMFLY